MIGGENKTRENEKLSALEERLRAIEGLNMYDSVDVVSLRLVPDVVVPPKFKIPDFDKYTGNSDPRIHLATYIAKMSALIEDDRLLVHFFHESLSGVALRWDLQNLVQRDREGFKEYAQRWREKAAEEKESTDVREMYFDGAVNLSGNGIGAVLVSVDGKHFPIAIKLRFDCTNNVSKYEACVMGLQAAIDMKVKKLEQSSHQKSVRRLYRSNDSRSTRSRSSIHIGKLVRSSHCHQMRLSLSSDHRDLKFSARE
ncbi:hypothetical protein P3X46_029998 [Hevea brasiliensis]|uniref:RNase H type-1 domain-containing protein n=1 Tax=Hevea brasiliensis TaxID=3981 RepID=A0ABQ9KV50_HEVBR|nr:hypothetical protein P3X46_029998 [Hevea brasiliensis]